MKKNKKTRKYFRSVAQAQRRVEEDERRARGEKTDNEQFAADLLERIRAK